MVSLSIRTITRLKLQIIREKLPYTYLARIKSIIHFPKEAPLCNLRAKASYTIEAAFILPLSLLMIVFFLYFFRVLYVQWAIDYTLNKVAREHASIISDSGSDDSVLILGQCSFEIASMDRVSKEVVGGVFGLDYTESEFNKNYINIICKYNMKNPITIFGKKTIKTYSTACSRKWVGYDPLEGDEKGDYVYVTKYGQAYHKSLSCPYLKPSVRAISAGNVKESRSVSGGKYSSCPICKGKKNTGTVYITDYGDVYHSSLNCSALKRSVNRIRVEDAKNFHPCGKCT
ncbi:MAG TPA: hypothetical protein DCR12_06060 [Lachnospiraceae bacterium]|nr:hypothetical protein [Lachnospiraceae bacterium]